jgi:phosphotransferase system enzyme I (PtsI)
MARLRGTGLGAGMALGTAAVVRVRGGIPTMPEPPPSIAEQIALRRLTETPEVIVVADDYRTGLALAGALKWATVVGLAAGYADSDAPVPPFPSVVNVPGLMDAVQDEMLMLVDAVRGIVLADPDPVSIAHYQAEHDHIAPKHRFYLDTPHLPAETLDGHTIQIVARVQSEQEIDRALQEGADALFVARQSPLLSLDADDETQRRSLLALAERAVGKPLLIADDYALSPRAVLEETALADITLIVPPRSDLEGLGLAELAEELKAAEAECFAEEVDFAVPLLGAYIGSGYTYEEAQQATAAIDALAARGATRIVFGLEYDVLNMDLLRHLEPLVAAASANLLPSFVAWGAFDLRGEAAEGLENTPEGALRLLVGLGVSGILTAADEVDEAKAMLREISFSECRESLLERLSK